MVISSHVRNWRYIATTRLIFLRCINCLTSGLRDCASKPKIMASPSIVVSPHIASWGFFREDPEWLPVARKNYERYIEIAALLGAPAIGSNPGALPRDLMGLKPQGLRCYIEHMKKLMHYAHDRGIEWLTIEPMSCLAEPPHAPTGNLRHG